MSHTPVLSIRQLVVAYPAHGGEREIVSGVDLDVYPGEIVGLVGESGAGKSTVGAAITGLIERPCRAVAGSVRLLGEEVLGLPDAVMRGIRGRRIGSVFQDPSAALNPVMTVGRQLTRAISLATGLDAAAAHRRAVDLVTRLGIKDAEKRLAQYPHQFSGGMRQRIVIAIALAGNPELLIADEPTTALDVSVQAEILDLLRSLCDERQLGILLVTHNMAVIQAIADRVVIMRHGRVLEANGTEAFFMSPQEDYTKALIRAVPPTDRKLERLAVWGDSGTAPADDPRLRKLEEAIRPPLNGGPLLSVEHISKCYISARGLLAARQPEVWGARDVSFEILPGEVVGLVGESGSGKSTIARLVGGIERPTSGTISYNGRSLSSFRDEAERRRHWLDVQMVFQDPFSALSPRQRVGDIIADPVKLHRLCAPEHLREVTRGLLAQVGLPADTMHRFPHEFSGGQRQRIVVARALALRPRLLICDEPTSALDVSVQAGILNLLKDLKARLGLSLLFISHDLAVVRQMCDRVLVMRDGALCEEGDTDAIFDRPAHPYTQHLIATMPRFTTELA